MPRYVRTAAKIVIPLLIILAGCIYLAFSKRQAYLQQEIDKAVAKAKKDYNLDVRIGSARFTGFSTVSFSDITVVPEHRDSLLRIRSFVVGIKVLPLVLGQVKLENVTLNDGHLNLTSFHHVRNFDFLFHKKKDTSENKKKIDLSEVAYNLVNQVLYKIPDNLDLHNFLISFRDDSAGLKMLTQTARISNGQLTSTIRVDSVASAWHLAGIMHPSDRNIALHLYAEHNKVELPMLQKRYHLHVSFDTITTRLQKVDNSGGITRIYGYWSVRNLLINHAALASNDIIVPYGSIDANMFVGKNYVSLDSSSLIHFRKATVRPYVKVQLRPVKMFTVKVNTGWLPAQDLFDSFPQGMFESLDGIRVTGKLKYHLHLFLDTSNPDKVQFESALDKQDFHILKYGKTDLGKLNAPFVYTPYENGKALPPRVIGPQNPNFTPLSDISPNLRFAVMTSEDPSFYTNHGFVVESFRRSIATDFKQKKFKRGGSTISMQLVKNTFLSRQKTLARKIEEILIVWLIENDHIMTKDRMLEVYFNVVEWGNNVYGIGEAAHYYFGKSPSDLTLGEGIFLASLLPHPKTGLYSFEPEGELRPSLLGYFNLIGKMMANRGWTLPDSSGYGYYSVRLKSSLRRKVAPVSTTVADSLLRQSNDEDEGVTFTPPIVERPKPEKKPGFFQRLFGRKDTVKKAGELEVDTVGKTKKEIRQEKRALRRLEKQRRKELHDKGLI